MAFVSWFLPLLDYYCYYYYYFSICWGDFSYYIITRFQIICCFNASTAHEVTVSLWYSFWDSCSHPRYLITSLWWQISHDVSDFSLRFSQEAPLRLITYVYGDIIALSVCFQILIPVVILLLWCSWSCAFTWLLLFGLAPHGPGHMLGAWSWERTGLLLAPRSTAAGLAKSRCIRRLFQAICELN